LLGQKIKKKKKAASRKLQAASLTRRILNDKVKTMTTINYNNKKMKLPFEIKTHSAAMVKRTNPLSGESTTLPGFAAAVYDYIIYKNMEAERLDALDGTTPGFSDNQDEWQIVRNGLDFFRRYFAKEYMVLLD
jgi:hypothetical protein